jgi:RNA polymerase sigma-70 factor (ECF subfamily)
VKAFRKASADRENSRRPGPALAEERRLVDAARAGDAGALRRLLDGVSRPIYRFAKGFCHDHTEAEDVLQGVLTAIARSLKDFRGESSLTTWAYTVARNACIRQRRRPASHPGRFEPLDAPGSDEAGALQIPDPSRGPHEQLEREELREVLEEAIAALPQAQREVLVLRDVDGRPAAEVGRILDLGERAVKSRLHRARLTLRAVLAPYLRGEPGGPRGRSKPAGRGPAAARPAVAGSSPAARSAIAAPRPAARSAIAAHCPDTARMLSRYLEGELDAGVCAMLESHVSACPSCGEACETLLAALGACRDWGTRPLSSSARVMVRAAIRAVVKSESR